MKVTNKMREEAKVIAEAHKAETVFVNKKGEFFTDRNFARNSVGGDEDKFAQVLPEVTKEAAPKAPAAPAGDNKEKN